MDTTSIWRATASTEGFPTLADAIEADVAIVGGGITGLTLALRLAEAGRRVVVVEAARVGSGTTGHSTGNLYETVREGLSTLVDAWDVDVARQVCLSRRSAIEFIERAVRLHRIDCGFRRCPMHLYATAEGGQDHIHREHEATRKIGLSAHLVDPAYPALAIGRMLVIEDQAQFHPLAYVQALAARLDREGVRIFESSPVTGIDEGRNLLRTPRGSVSAAEIVLATHTPKGLFGVHAEMTVQREYAVAAPLSADAFPEGIFWGFGDFPHSLRSVEVGGRRCLVVVGEAHKTGHHEAASTLRRLEDFARSQLGAGEIAYRWSAQSYRSPDLLPYVGKTMASRTTIATGFATDGLTYGTLAANLIADDLLGEENPWHALYKATRFSPIKAARGVIEENVTVARAFVADRLAPADEHAFRTVMPDAGAIVSVDGERFAAYRSPSGSLALVSPICTHMGCIVHWNAVEKSWDCPCHGSRFGIDGRVLEGPALAPLENLSDRGA